MWMKWMPSSKPKEGKYIHNFSEIGWRNFMGSCYWKNPQVFESASSFCKIVIKALINSNQLLSITIQA